MASAVKYLSNVAKSVKYASIDVLKELNPVITDHIETNADVAKTTYSTIKNFKSISAKAAKSLSNSQVGELAKEAKNNILEDIKKGTFYNKAREDKMFDAASADMFDGEDFDFSVDMSEDLDDTAMLAETIDNVGEKTSSAVSQVLARTAEYQVEATRQSTVRLLAQQSAMTATLHSDLSTVNANIAGVLKFNTEVAATHYENSKLFYETQQKQMDEQTSILKEMLDLQKSVLTPKSKSLNNKISASDLFTSTGALNIAEYFKYVKQNAKDNSSELGDMAELIQGVGIGRAIVSNPIGTIMKMAMKSMTPKMLKDAMAEFNETIAGSISTALINLTDMKDSTNPIFSAIGNMFGIDVTAKKKLNVGNYHKDATAWTGKDHKALVDVIPTLLGKIYSSVSGKDELRYDYESGTYKSMNQIQKDFKRMKSSSISDANEDILPYLQKYMNKLDFKGDDKRRQQLIDNLEKILEYNFDKAKYFNPKDRSLSAKTYGLKGDFADKDLDIIRKMFEAIPKNKQLKNQTSMIEGIHRFNEKMKKMEESGDSIFNALFDESVFDSKKNSPLFAATSKIDTTNEILRDILDTIKGGSGKKSNKKQNKKPITKTITKAEKEKKDETEETIKFSSLGFNLEQNKDAKISLTDDDIAFLDDETDTGSEYIKGIKKAKTATQKLKAFLKGFNTLANQPVKFMANTLKKVDRRIYNILFGQGNGDDTESILGKMRDGLDDWFDDLKTRTRNKFDDIKDAIDQYGVKNKFQSLMKTMFGFDMQTWEKDFKEALFGTKDKSFVEGMKDLFKEGFSDMWKGVKDIFKPAKEEAKKTVFGEKNEKGKAKEEKNNAFKDILYQAGRKPKDDGTGDTKDIPNAATGARQVSKTGVIAVSEGEVILPPDLNETNVKKRYRAENNAISKFKKAYGDIGNIQSFAEGGKFDPKKKYSSGYTHEELIELVRMAREEGMSSTEIYDMLVESMGFGKERIDRSDYVEGKENIFYKMKDAATDFVNSARENEFIDSVMGKIGKSISKKAPKEGQEVVEDVVGNFSQYLPRIAAGGVTGMALSALLGLAGGPLLGAAVGSGLGLLSKSKTLQTFLFGKEITNDDGTKGRDGSGLISKNIVNNVNKYFPNMAKGAIVGGITSLLPFIPGGPIAGIMVGSAVGFARSNDNLKTSLFGEEGKLTKIGKTLKEKLPKMGLGAAAMALGGPFGLTTNLILGAGLGFVSDTDKFKDIVFGTKGFDGKRAGGLVGFIRDAAEIPINGIRNLFNKTLDWFKTDILDPVKKGLGPFYQQLKNIGNWVKDGITNSFKDHITRPIGAFLIDKIIKPLETGVGKLINGILKPVKFVLSAPFKVFGAAGQVLERRQLRKTGAASGTASERIRKREALDKNRKRKKYTNTAANTVDTMVSKATNEELEEYKMLNEIALSTGGLTGRKRKQKKIIDKYTRSLVGKSGLDDLLYSHVQRNPRQLTLEDYKSIMNEVAEGNYEGSVTLITESPIFPEELKATACKKIKDTAKQVKDAREKAADFKTAARKIKEKTGVDVSQRSFGRVIDQEAKGRGLGNKTKNEKETEKQTSENKIPNILQDNHNQAMDILTKISNTLEDIAHPEKRRRKKRNKKKQDEAPVTAVMTLSDAIQAQENGDTALANDIATGKITRFSQFKKKAKSSLNRMKAKAVNKVKSVMTEHGIIKTRTDAQGNEIEDMRDSETRETVEKREESAKIQHGMFAKISSLTSGVLGFFGKGKDEEEEEEGGFLSFLGKILKFAGPALLGVGAIGLAKSAADKKIQVQKRDANGNKMYDENGNPIMTETTIADAVKDGASRMWLGDDLTGNTSGAWYHIKDFTRNTLIPTLGAGFDVILENIPKVISALTKTLVESAPEVLFAIGKGLGSGIWSVAKKYLSKIPGVGKLFGDDEEKDSDKKSSEDIESAGGNVTITKNLANKGSSAPISNSKGSSDIKLTESSSEIVSSMQKSFDATFGGSKTQQPKDTKTTSSAIQEAATNISASGNAATGTQTPMVAATSTVQAASNDDVKSSIAYSRACKSVQKKSLSQLSNIWNQPIFDDGTTTAQLCNDSKTVIAQYTTDDGETVSVTGADILLYPEIASQVLGIDISLTDKERDENSEQIRNATGRDPGAYTAAKVILTGGGYGAMTAKRGIKAIHGLGNAAEKLGNGMYRVSQVTKHIPGFRKVSKFVGGHGKFSGKAAKLHSRLAAVPLQATEGARKLYRGYSASRKAGKSVTESIKTTAGHFKNRMSKSVGKAQEAASAALDARKAKRAEKLANSKGLMSKITKPIKSVKNKVLDKADDAINKVVNIDANDVNKAKKGLTGAFSSLRSKSEKINKAASAVGNAADKVKDKAGKLTGKAAELADNLKTVLGNFFNSSDVLKKFEKVHKQCRKKFSSEAVSKALKEFSEKILEKFTKGLGKVAAKTISKVSAKLASYIGTAGIAAAAFLCIDFISGWSKADVIMQVEKPTTLEKLVSAIVNAFAETFFITLIIDTKDLVQMSINMLEGLSFNFDDLRKRQKEAEEACDAYNREHGTNYTVDEYLEKDKISTKIKKGLKAAGKWVKDKASDAWDWTKKKASNLWNGAKSFLGFSDKEEDNEKETKEKEDNKESSNSGESFYNNVKGTAQTVTEQSSAINQVAESTENMADPEKLFYDDKGNVIGKGMDENGVMTTSYIPQGDAETSAEDAYVQYNMEHGTNYTMDEYNTITQQQQVGGDVTGTSPVNGLVGSKIAPISKNNSGIISSQNTSMIMKAAVQVNGMIPGMIKQCKSMIARLFGLPDSEMNKQNAKNAAIYKTKEPQTLFGQLTSMWKNIAAKVNPFANMLPRTMSTAMEGLSKFLAVSMGYADPTDENVDLSRVTTESYMDKRADIIAANSAFYNMTAGVSGSNSNNESTQVKAVKSSKSKKKSSKKKGILGTVSDGAKSFIKGVGKLFGIGGSGSGINDTDAIQEPNPSEEYFVSQRYGNYASKSFTVQGDKSRQTISDAGCAPAAAVMAVNKATYNSLPLSMNDAIKNALPYKLPNGGVTADYFVDEFQRHNLGTSFIASEDENRKSNSIRDSLLSGKRVILMGKDEKNTSKNRSPFGPKEHYVVATGLSKDKNTIYINDPERRKPNIAYNFKDIIKHTSLGIVPISRGKKKAPSANMDKLKKILKKFSASGKYGPDTIEYKVWTGLRAAGYNEITVAAAMGNIKNESGFDPGAIEAGSGAGFGLIQWTGGRRTAIEQYAASKGVSASDIDLQLEYLIKECNPDDPIFQWNMKSSSNYSSTIYTFEDWRDGKDLERATWAFMTCFERPAYSSSTNHIDRRLNDAKMYYEEFTGTAVPDGTTKPGEGKEDSGKKSVITALLEAFDKLGAAFGLTDGGDEGSTGEEGESSGSSTINVDGISGNVSSNPQHAEKQRQLAAMMKQHEGQIQYSWGPDSKYPGPTRDPSQVIDGKRYGDCSSTVQWVYKDVLGVDPGPTTGPQETDPDTYTVATSLSDESKLQLGDLLLKDGHVEMYFGNGQMIGHGGGQGGKTPGPTIKPLGGSAYHNVRRWVGFQGSGSGLTFVSQNDSNYANKSIGNEKVSAAGCAPAVATMAVNSVSGNTLDMNKAIRLASQYKSPTGGVTADYFVDEFDRHGLMPAFMDGKDNDVIMNHLANGNPVILMGQDPTNRSKTRSPFGPTNHYVLATGISKDRRTIYVNDPESKKSKLRYSKDILKHTTFGITPVKGKMKGSSSTMSKLRSKLKLMAGKANETILYSGDSRTEGMKLALGESSTLKFVCKPGTGYKWLKDTAVGKIKSIVKENPNTIVIFAFGVNDLPNIDYYTKLYKKFADETKANIWYMSVNPVDSNVQGPYDSVDNTKIEAFNAKLKSFAGGRYIDTYNYLLTDGFTAPDSLHYDNDTYKKIHEYCLSAVNGTAPESANGSTSSGSQSPITAILDAFEQLSNAYMGIDPSTTGSSSGSTSGSAYPKYDLDNSQKDLAAGIIAGETGGSDPVAAAQEASQMANLNEVQYGRQATGADLRRTLTGGWYASTSMDNAPTDVTRKAVEDVLVNGKRTLPRYVTEHDMFPLDAAIDGHWGNGKSEDRSQYKQHTTKIKQNPGRFSGGGATYTFWDFFGQNKDGDVSGYYDKYYQQYKDDVAWSAGSGSGLSDKVPTYNYGNKSPQSGSSSRIVPSNQTKQVQQSSNVDKLIDVVITLLSQVVDNTSSIKDIAKLLVNIIDIKGTSGSSADNTVASDLLATKTLALKALKDSAKNTKDQALENLIRNVEAIARQ